MFLRSFWLKKDKKKETKIFSHHLQVNLKASNVFHKQLNIVLIVSLASADSVM